MYQITVVGLFIDPRQQWSEFYLLYVSSLVGLAGIDGGRRATNHTSQFRALSGWPHMPSACCLRIRAGW